MDGNYKGKDKVIFLDVADCVVIKICCRCGQYLILMM